jgi:hypothetical protein
MRFDGGRERQREQLHVRDAVERDDVARLSPAERATTARC